MRCRFCKTALHHVFIDLANTPLSNSFLKEEQLDEPETFYPLKVYTCHECFLVQVDEYRKSDAIFNSEYVYFSSYSSTWLEHARTYVEMMVERFGFSRKSQVVEIASNDGYLLQYFVRKNIPVLGIEPSANTAEAARAKGVESITEFFGLRLARELRAKNLGADLLIGNNVLAHVPDIIDFLSGAKHLLNPRGVFTLEFPHLQRLVEHNQFDTIYHEHFSYLSFTTAQRIFKSLGLEIFDVQELPTHGGSLRIFAHHEDEPDQPVGASVAAMLQRECDAGMTALAYYNRCQSGAQRAKLDLLSFLIEQKRAGRRVVAYGAAAKGNTLLNYCGVHQDLVEFVADANPNKQNKWLPGSHIPVVAEGRIRDVKPAYVLVLPWNLEKEIATALAYVTEWGGHLMTAIPELRIWL
ncbi:MAG: methyltransferase domain-containing protein [Panacagrimonas sp.]